MIIFELTLKQKMCQMV